MLEGNVINVMTMDQWAGCPQPEAVKARFESLDPDSITQVRVIEASFKDPANWERYEALNNEGDVLTHVSIPL